MSAIRTKLGEGGRVIIPATFEPNVASNFMMRVFAEGPMEIREFRNSDQ